MSYINKEKLLDRCSAWCDNEGVLCISLKDIANAPAEDVAPVIHAQWIFDGGSPCIFPQYICSNCKTGFRKEPYMKKGFKRCPECGAIMDLESDEE